MFLWTSWVNVTEISLNVLRDPSPPARLQRPYSHPCIDENKCNQEWWTSFHLSLCLSPHLYSFFEELQVISFSFCFTKRINTWIQPTWVPWAIILKNLGHRLLHYTILWLNELFTNIIICIYEYFLKIQVHWTFNYRLKYLNFTVFGLAPANTIELSFN